MAYSDLFSVDVVLALLALFKTLVPHAAPLWQQKYIQCFCDCKGMNISSTCPLFAPARVIVLPTEIHCVFFEMKVFFYSSNMAYLNVISCSCWHHFLSILAFHDSKETPPYEQCIPILVLGH